MLISCNKTENKEHHHNRTVKNEMVAIMDEMMEDMHSAKPTGNIDADYAKMMIDHHKGAVVMSELLLKKGNNAELKTFAENVISAQNKEINLMEKFINEKEVSKNHQSFQDGLNQSMAVMMKDDIKIHDDIDKDYTEQMIPHHQSAVEMAKVYLKYGNQKDLIKLSKEIIEVQNVEINFLKNWLTEQK